MPKKPSKPASMTARDARRAIVWFRKRMGLEDWEVRLHWQSLPPDWIPENSRECVGYCKSHYRFKVAFVWINPSMCTTYETDPLSIVFHECCHMLLTDVGIHDGGRCPSSRSSC